MRPSYRLLALLVGLVAFAASLAVAPPAGARSLADLVAAARQQPRPAVARGVFGSLEMPAKSRGEDSSWRHVLERHATERRGFAACLTAAGACPGPQWLDWRAMMHAARRLGPRARLAAVNSFFNLRPYRRDRDGYGQREYWASPSEFMRQGGDCEDFAIAKYFALRRLGFEPEALRLVVLEDHRSGEGHAVLAVTLDEETLILDNRSDALHRDSAYRHYSPQYSMNERARWTHLARRAVPASQAYAGLASAH